MRFILFNIVVAAGLVYLLTGTDGPIASTGRGVISNAVLKATEIGDQVAERLARVDTFEASETPLPAGLSAGNRDREDSPPAPKADETTKLPPQAPTGGRAIAGRPAENGPPPLPPAIPVAPREPRAVPANPAVAARGLDADVRQRRAEVLGEATPKSRVTIEEGSELMTPTERRRDLDALVEQMELLYIGQRGG